MVEPLPKKLKNDAILEAVLEIRFEPDPSLVPEIIFGRFADVPAWRDFRQARLPMADIPAPIRRADPNLRYQPSIELVSKNGGTAVRFGPQVLIFARRGDYPGWEWFGAELESAVDHLYRAVPGVRVSRMGLRYINALLSDVHGIKTADDIAITVSVAGKRFSQSLNLNFKTNAGTKFETMCRIATVDLAEGNIPKTATVIIDIDVYTSGDYSSNDPWAAKHWIQDAHMKEKESFFTVLGSEATARLRVD